MAAILAGRGGVRRFAEHGATGLAAAGAEVERIEVGALDPPALGRLAAAVADTDVAVVNWSPNLVVDATSDAAAPTASDLLAAVAALPSPVAVISHDVYEPPFGRVPGRLLRRLPAGARVAARHVLGGRRLEQLVGLTSVVDLADLVVAVSAAEHRRVIEAGAPRTSLLPLPVIIDADADTGAWVRAELGWDDRVHVVLPGFVHRRKGLDVAVAALRRLDDRFVLIAAGAPAPGSEPWVDEVLGDAADLVAAGRLRVAGPLDDHHYEFHLAAADVVVAPYRRIAASGSLLDAAKYGRPIVASPTEFADELRVDGTPITAVGSWTADAWARAITSAHDRGPHDPSRLRAARDLGRFSSALLAELARLGPPRERRR